MGPLDPGMAERQTLLHPFTVLRHMLGPLDPMTYKEASLLCIWIH